jgi:hypothetical protein
MLGLFASWLVFFLLVTLELVKYNDPIIRAIWWAYFVLGVMILGVWAFKKFFGGE